MKKIWIISPMLIIALLSLILFTVVAFFENQLLFYFEVCVTGLVVFFSVINYFRIRMGVFKYVRLVTKALGDSEEAVMEKYPIPVMLADSNGEILWYNNAFSNNVINNNHIIGHKAQTVIGDKSFSDIIDSNGTNIDCSDRCFTVYGREIKKGSSEYCILFFTDDTQLKNIAKTYEMTKPSVIYLAFDNYDEMTANAKESEKGAILGAVEHEIDTYIAETNGFSVRYAVDKFIIVIEEKNLKKLVENKFPLLDKMRSIKRGERSHATVSIGVGSDTESLRESEQLAAQALDMALGRGGDQAAVKSKNGYTFFGGISKGIVRRTKVRSRIIAKALTDLISASENVFIMGHKFGDLDSIGSAIALQYVASELGRPAYIVVDKEKNLSVPLLDTFENKGIFVNPSNVTELVTKRSLVIIVDTHNPEILESKELYKACKSVVVIDHHRKMVNYVDDAVIFYHEAYASSTCEMVTELLEYIDEVEIGKNEAEALLSGIMMDTKNFVMKTGVRTFEAAAFLKGKGADTIAVKRLFAGSMDAYMQKSQFVGNAQIYKNYAISYYDGSFENIRITASQAADELLTIQGVDASFVLYFDNDEVIISARSLGTVNVQVIMEALGGGGHQTMAGAQLKDMTVAQANLKLVEILSEE